MIKKFLVLVSALAVGSTFTAAENIHKRETDTLVEEPTLPPRCASVSCFLQPVCGPGEILDTPEGQCCPKCLPDCSAVPECPVFKCQPGQILVTPEGQCCPVCRPTCEIEGQVFSQCASCPRTCDDPLPFCTTECRPGCECPLGQVVDTTIRRCVPVERCPPTCPIEGQKFSFCGGCDSTCNQIINGQPRICPAVCRPGCSCPGAQSIDSAKRVCVNTDDCPNPCALVDCEPNARCKVVLETGEPFCEPSCDIANGGCADNQVCKERNAVCKTAPCPPAIECLERSEVCFLNPAPGTCEAAIAQYFHNATSGQCERFTYGGCGGNDNRFDTRIECQKACGIDPCASKQCGPGSVCRVFEFTGEAFCDPSCEIDNGGCRADQTCELVPVFCIRAPCPPMVQCSDPDPCDRCPKGTFCDVSVSPCQVPPCPTTAQCLTQKEVCELPYETGDCKGFFPRFFHNEATGQCEEFIYGGCGGNPNNFRTRKQCERACGVLNACALVLCSPGTFCRIDERTGEPVCEPPDLCATVRCANGFRCEVFQPVGDLAGGPQAFCNPDCNLNNGGCPLDKLCQLIPTPCPPDFPCPPVRRCVDPEDDSQPPCPPTCSKKFCTAPENRRALCSKPGPRELPGCTGPCQLTYCHACYYSEDTISPVPGNCQGCTDVEDYISNNKCFKRWANCVKIAHKWNHGNPPRGDRDEEDFKCYSPPCAFKG